jgi:hypothetical protein
VAERHLESHRGQHQVRSNQRTHDAAKDIDGIGKASGLGIALRSLVNELWGQISQQRAKGKDADQCGEPAQDISEKRRDGVQVKSWIVQGNRQESRDSKPCDELPRGKNRLPGQMLAVDQ